MSERSCRHCKYEHLDQSVFPCRYCSNNYINKFEPITRRDQINAMDNKEFAEWLDKITDDGCEKYCSEFEAGKPCNCNCVENIKQWLETEVEEVK
jgi:hypothetical protein